MRRILFVLVAIFLSILLCPLHAEAALSLAFNYASIDFGNMDMGVIKDDVPSNGLVITCNAEAGSIWTLKIRNDFALMHISNPASMIPNTNFKWYGVSTSDPSNTSLVLTREDFTFEKTIYTGAVTETQTDVTIKFELTIPPVLQSGTYEANMVFTLTQ